MFHFLSLYVPGYIRLITSACAHLEEERQCARDNMYYKAM